MTHFVYINGLKGPEPQLWASEPVDDNGKPVKAVLFKQKLSSEEEALSLDQLNLKFKDRLAQDASL